MKLYRQIFIITMPVLEIISSISAFFVAYFLRGITDGIPFIQLRIPFISLEQFTPFVIAGTLLWIIVFGQRKLYRDFDDTPLVEEFRQVFVASFVWLIVFVGIVYFTTGFLFSKEIPRLIILYTFVLLILFSLSIRSIRSILIKKIQTKHILHLPKFLIVYEGNVDDARRLIDVERYRCQFFELSDTQNIDKTFRERSVDGVILAIDNPYKNTDFIFKQGKIYGIPCMYPQILPHMKHFSRRERFIGGTPMFELSSVSMSFWQSFFKRIFDFVSSALGLIILSPVLLILYIGIKIEDSSGPAIYKNKRIGKNGKPFTLYKFRYMYWKDSTKEAYGENANTDTAMEYEEELKKTQNTRSGPLYKIENDPRKMRFGAFIERLSLDELPQLWNVLKGDMSLVGPRPHQPREVELYNESDKQVLTIQPGITGMAQVYGRDKNSFHEEVAYDIHYIENYSFTLDIAILIRTVFVVLSRPFSKRKK